jgi:hypothetical protein
MKKRALCAVVPVALAVAAAPAIAGSSSTTLRVIGGPSLKPNRYEKDSMRFAKDVVNVNSGGRIAIRNRTGEAHTFSIVRRSEQIRNARGFGTCFAPSGRCAKVSKDHGLSEDQSGPPAHVLVNKGRAGFNQVGDSIVFDSKGKTGSNPTIQITAARGTTLYAMCVIHPWMQTRINVH